MAKSKPKKNTGTNKEKPPKRCTIDFKPNGITSPAIEMEGFLWNGSAEVCITMYEDSVSNVYVNSPADLEKMATWLLKAAEWMRKEG